MDKYKCFTAQEKEEIKLHKLSKLDLNDLYDQLKSVLTNKSLLANLPDKGELLKIRFDKVKKELESREAIEQINESISNLALDTETVESGHVNVALMKEKNMVKERFKPHKTLKELNEMPPQNTANLLPLKESIVLMRRNPNQSKGESSRLRLDDEDEEEESSSENEADNSD